jgi:hypothetical protein
MTDQSIEDASRNNWTTKQWAEHVGAWENEQGQVCFGSWQALAAMLSQFQQDARQSSQSEPVASIIFNESEEYTILPLGREVFKLAPNVEHGLYLAAPQQAIPSDLDALIYEHTKFNVNQADDAITIKGIKSLINAVLSASPTAPIESDK